MKYLYLLLFLFCASNVSAQETAPQDLPLRDFHKNEISINAFNLTFFGALDAAYERVLSNTTSLSLGVFYKKYDWEKAEDPSDGGLLYSKEFSVISKFNYFFNEEKMARGIYAEVIAMYSRGINKTTTIFPADVSYPPFEDFGAGIGLGYKYVAKKGLVIDLSYGIGRNLFDKDSPSVFLVPNINVGYRF